MLFLLVVLLFGPPLFGFACGYGVRELISRRRRRRYRQRQASKMAEDIVTKGQFGAITGVTHQAATTISSRRPRWVPILVVVALVAATIVAVPFVREPLLRAAGWALIVNEPIAPADIIVVSAAARGAGALEAADLVQSGIATRVAVFSDPPSGEDHEFIRRGLPYEDEAAKQIRQLKWLGVTDVVQIPRTEAATEAGTEGEGQALPPWCDQHQFRSIVLVTVRDHSRRWRRVLDRVMKGHPTRVTVQPARYSKFDPDRWWKTRDGVRTEIVELEKLVLDAVLHPRSLL
jgi:hypothetical protein